MGYTMADKQKTDKGKDGEDYDKKNKVRITLTCRNVKSIERVTSDLILRAKKRNGVKVHGPVRHPVKSLVINTRRTPCGEGSKTWERYEMKIYKRVIDLECTNHDIKEITTIRIDPGVEVELVMVDSEEK